jgi:hypothetical protein
MLTSREQFEELKTIWKPGTLVTCHRGFHGGVGIVTKQSSTGIAPWVIVLWCDDVVGRLRYYSLNRVEEYLVIYYDQSYRPDYLMEYLEAKGALHLLQGEDQ